MILCMTCQAFYKATSFEVFTCYFFLGAFSVSQNVLWTPSKLIARLGKEINNESSYLYWAYKVSIRPTLMGRAAPSTTLFLISTFS